MTMRLIEVMSLVQLMESLKAEKMKIVTAYNMNKLMTAVDTQIQFYRTKVTELLEKYGETEEDGSPTVTEDGQGRVIKEEFLEVCQKEMQELNDLQVDIPDIHFTLDEFESVNMSLSDMRLLMPFIKEN